MFGRWPTGITSVTKEGVLRAQRRGAEERRMEHATGGRVEEELSSLPPWPQVNLWGSRGEVALFYSSRVLQARQV